MKVKIECKYKVTVSGDLPLIQSDPNNDAEPNLYPGLKNLENPTSPDIVNHVLHNHPQVNWVLDKTSDETE